jgi:hypothetical protein
MYIMAIDPGACAGWAWGTTDGGLMACGHCYPDRGQRPPSSPGGLVQQFALLVVELPLLTSGKPTNGAASVVTRGNNLIALAVRLGRLVESVQHYQLEQVYPSQWKGQVPKDIHHPRIIDSLDDGERALVSMQPDELDAVGLFKWAQKVHGRRA